MFNHRLTITKRSKVMLRYRWFSYRRDNIGYLFSILWIHVAWYSPKEKFTYNN